MRGGCGEGGSEGEREREQVWRGRVERVRHISGDEMCEGRATSGYWYPHPSYLRGCRGQFLQPHKVPLLHLHDLLPLHGEEPLEGGDELKVGGGCHVVVSAEFGQEPG